MRYQVLQLKKNLKVIAEYKVTKDAKDLEIRVKLIDKLQMKVDYLYNNGDLSNTMCMYYMQGLIQVKKILGEDFSKINSYGYTV